MAVPSQSIALLKTISETICKEGNVVAISQREQKKSYKRHILAEKKKSYMKYLCLISRYYRIQSQVSVLTVQCAIFPEYVT